MVARAVAPTVAVSLTSAGVWRVPGREAAAARTAEVSAAPMSLAGLNLPTSPWVALARR